MQIQRIPSEEFTEQNASNCITGNNTIAPQETQDMTRKNAPICKFFIKGTCIFGKTCMNSHDIKNRENMPECKHFLRGKCRFGDDCIYYHHTTDVMPESFSSQKNSWRNVNGKPTSGPYHQTPKPTSGPYHQTSKPTSGLYHQTPKPTSGLYHQTPKPTSGSYHPQPTVKICEQCGNYLISSLDCEICCKV